MGLEVGKREYHALENKPRSNLRSISAQRAHLIIWRKKHPGGKEELARIDALLDFQLAKIRLYNETLYSLQKRAGNKPPPHLSGAIQRLENLKEHATLERGLQINGRNSFAYRLYDWENKLPQLDEQIARLR